MFAAHQTVQKSGATKRIGPFAVPKCMSSTISANLATAFKIKGINYSITSACSDVIALYRKCCRTDNVRQTRCNVCWRRRGVRLDFILPVLTRWVRCHPKTMIMQKTASRAFDADRDGFVISGGGGIVVLEELEHAKLRGAKIYAEITGYAATSDGHDMVAPSGEGGETGHATCA